MSNTSEFLWYIPNQDKPGHRGDSTSEEHNSLETLTIQAKALEEHGWKGALIGTGWGRPDTFTLAAALAAQTTTFEPLIAIRPGYWRPAQFASAAASRQAECMLIVGQADIIVSSMTLLSGIGISR